MIKEIAWDTFKQTGDINTFLEFKQIQEIEAKLNAQEIGNIQKITNMQLENQTIDSPKQNL